MTVDASLAGRTFPPTEPYVVTHERLAEFARARVYPSLLLAPLAQSAERLHGKEKVYGSIP